MPFTRYKDVEIFNTGIDAPDSLSQAYNTYLFKTKFSETNPFDNAYPVFVNGYVDVAQIKSVRVFLSVRVKANKYARISLTSEGTILDQVVTPASTSDTTYHYALYDRQQNNTSSSEYLFLPLDREIVLELNTENPSLSGDVTGWTVESCTFYSDATKPVVMTLRDYFAIEMYKTLNPITFSRNSNYMFDMCVASYRFADTMLSAKEFTKQEFSIENRSLLENRLITKPNPSSMAVDDPN